MTLADQLAAVLCASGPQPLSELARYGSREAVHAAMDELVGDGRAMQMGGEDGSLLYGPSVLEATRWALEQCRAQIAYSTQAVTLALQQLTGAVETLASIEPALRAFAPEEER